MNIINVENITKSYTERKLFSKASFYVQEQEKVGIVGINGTGKSTLLKILAQKEIPDEGTITMGRNLRIGYLPQNPSFDEETVLAAFFHQLQTLGPSFYHTVKWEGGWSAALYA